MKGTFDEYFSLSELFLTQYQVLTLILHYRLNSRFFGAYKAIKHVPLNPKCVHELLR